MDWLEPIVKWGVLAAALFGGFALQRTRAQSAGKLKEQKKQLEEGDRAQEAQLKRMASTNKRDLLDELKRVRDRKNRR